MDEITTLTPKQEAFCVHYVAIGAETFSNGTKAAIAAGYSETSAYSQASTMLKNPKIQERIQELYKDNMTRNMISVDKILADLENTKIKAEREKQFGASIRASELQGKYLAMFTERFTGGSYEEQRKYSEREKEEIKAIALIRVNQIIEAERKESEVKVNGQDGQNSGEDTPSTPQQAPRL